MRLIILNIKVKVTRMLSKYWTTFRPTFKFNYKESSIFKKEKKKLSELKLSNTDVPAITCASRLENIK